MGVTGCWFYDRDPSNPYAMQFDLVDANGCNKPPSYYDPFTAATTPGVNGMYMNHQPYDTALMSGPTQSIDPMVGAPGYLGYLSGAKEAGMAYSDKLKMFKFPGTRQVWAKCTLRFCVEDDDPRCITVSWVCLFV